VEGASKVVEERPPAEEEEVGDDEGEEGREDKNMRNVRACFEMNKLPRFSPRAVHTSYNHSAYAPVVQLENIVDEDDIGHLYVMTSCVRQVMPKHFEDRKFDQGVTGYGGGNNVTYIGGFVETLMPEFANHILGVAGAAADLAGWRPHPRHLGFRCIETLEYYTGGELLMHTDSDSIYTMVIMLGYPSNFTGGEFVIKPRPLLGPDKWGSKSKDNVKAWQFLSPSHSGGVFFDSNAEHSVEPIEKGERIVLAIELWPFVDTGIYDLRPNPDGYKNRVKKPELLSVKQWVPPRTPAQIEEDEKRETALDDAKQRLQHDAFVTKDVPLFASGIAFGLAGACFIYVILTSFGSSSPRVASAAEAVSTKEIDEKKDK